MEKTAKTQRDTPSAVAWQLSAVVVLLLMTACGLPAPDGRTSSSQSTPVPQVKHRDFLSVMYCPENTGEYSRVLFHEANALVAQSVASLVSSNQAGAVIYVNLLDNSPARPENSVLTLRIPAIPAFPQAPMMTPSPTIDSQDPYGSSNKQSTVTTWDTGVSSAYQNQVKAVQRQLDSANKDVQVWGDQLRALNPRLGSGPANIWECVQEASHRFNGWPGERFILIAGTLPNPGDASTWYRLGPDVHFRFIFTGCSSIPSCQSGEGAWGQALSAAGVRDQRYFDAGESQALSTVFGN
jgi:hypothetical protein